MDEDTVTVARNPTKVKPEGVTNGHGNHDDFESPTPPTDDNITETESSSNSEVTSTSSTTIDYHWHPIKCYMEGAINHLFLPKRVPSTSQQDLVFVDEWILHHVSDILQEVNFDPIIPIRKMFEIWKFLQPKSSTSDQVRFSQRFSHRMGEMKIGDCVGLYVRRQNCTLFISKLDEDYTLVETFRPSLPSESIMSVVGAVTVKYPETSNVIHHKDLLASQVFAKHLHELCTNHFDASMKSAEKANQQFLEYREVPDPFLISDWLLALLVPGCHHKYTPIQVTKKVRDDVNCKRSAKAVPFRRSGIWMSIKVALYLRLVHVIGNENDAKVIYKTILLWILADVCKQYSETYSPPDIDLASQMLTKLGRRVKKVQKLTCAENSMYAQEIVKLWSSTLQFVYTVITSVHEQIRLMWTSTCAPNKILSVVDRGGEEFLQDLVHSIPFLDEYINSVQSKPDLYEQNTSPVFTSENLASSLQLKRYPTTDSILKPKSLYSSDNELTKRIWLYDTECFLKSQLDVLSDPVLVLRLISIYIQSATITYSGNDPVGVSQIYLLCLKAIQILDQIATKRFPLLKQYSPGISPKKFDKLLLPHRTDLVMLDTILTYFSKRDSVAYHPCIIDKRDVTKDTFAVRFAADCQPMLQLQKTILNDTEFKIEQKMVEVVKEKKKCVELQEQVKLRETCTDCIPLEQCSPCQELEDKLERKRYSVPVYERPLPIEVESQLAIVFELMAPPEIVCLREALAILRFDLLGKHYSYAETTKWMDLKCFQEYKRISVPTPHPAVTLCSQQLATSKTHYTRIKNPDLLTVEIEPDSFVVDNGLDCLYEFKKSFSDAPSLGSHSTRFNLDSTAQSEHDLYLPFQWALESTEHTQNKIIAQVSAVTSHPELIAFGSLRGGHRIQLMNLYKYISSRELALEKESVVAIILQTLWEVGPLADGSRESHLDFQHTRFALEVLRMLTKLVEQNDTNYANPLILLNVVIITSRILELAQGPQCSEACYELLKKCRQTASSWLTMIDNQIDTVSGSGEENMMESSVQNLLVTRAHIAITSALTYDTDGSEQMFGTVIQSEEDVVGWLDTLLLLNQLTQQEHVEQFLSPFSQILLTRARMVALKLNMEKKVTSLETKEYFSKCLHMFTCSKWERADTCVTPGDPDDALWSLLESNSNVVFREYTEASGDILHSHLLTFDLILGTFLVNGYLQSGLPLCILDNPLFQLYFKGAPIKVQGYQPNCFRTVEKFHGNHYHFEVSASTGVRIREVREDRKWDLVDPHRIRGCIWDGWVDGYTHWVDVERKIVQFRVYPNADADYRLPPQLTLKKDDKYKNGWRLCDERVNCWLLERESSGFKAVYNHLSRLETKDWVNVLMDKKSGVISAKLPRHHLTFELINGYLHSVEYAGFKVSSNQAWGTLIGLRQGILLETDAVKQEHLEYSDKQLVLIPHGKIETVLEAKESHQQVTIPLEELRQPSLFVYEFDHVLKRLKADKSKSAWLYLAALHASTSGAFCDPFTAATGTEMAVGILQSAFVWSCAPYDPECLITLKMIKKMAPKRTYYGHELSKVLIEGSKKQKLAALAEQMETVEWPVGLPSMAAFDGYAIIIDKLLEDSRRLQALHSGGESPRGKYKEKASAKLQMRGYQVHLDAYNKAVAMKSHLVTTSVETFNEGAAIGKYCAHRNVGLDDDDDKYFNLKALLSLAQTRFLGHLQLVDESKRESNLASYLLTSEPLAASFPPPAVDSLSLKQVLEYEMGTNWLKLYSVATADKPMEKHFFSVLLASLAYQGRPMEQILNLHNISVLSQTINFPKIPFVLVEASFADPSTCDLDEEQIRAFLLDRASVYFSYILKNGSDYGDVKLKAKQRQLEIEGKIDQVIAKIKMLWPCERISRKALDELNGISGFWTADDFIHVNKLVTSWFWNFKLKSFVESVENILNKFYQHMATPRRQSVFQFDPLNELEMEVKLTPSNGGSDLYFEDVDKCVMLSDDNLEEAALIFYAGCGFQSGEEHLISQRDMCREKIASYWETIQTLLTKTASKKLIYITSVAPRLTPTLLAQYLLYGLKQLKMKMPVNNKLVTLIGALCVLWVELRRFNRCIALLSQGDLMASELQHELENSGHTNWSPRDNPEWLLLELELDITIRPVQVQVARQMISMPDKKNGVMQLNMGEGKTSVIVPMLCATLANEETLCRVTVLQSIFKTNMTILSFAVGGLLSRRLYTFPCRRDMPIDVKCLSHILHCYQECMKLKGVVLSLPEHRLSFRLLSYDKTLKAYPELGIKIREIENGLRRFARDILDESDELLGVKYQLVYTMGSQVTVDGGKLRWTICQKLLDIVQQVGEQLLEICGATKVEFSAENQKFPERFGVIRLLDGECRDLFLDVIATELLKETKLTERQKSVVKRFLIQENFSEENFKYVVSLFKNDSSQLDELRLLYGYLQRNILCLGLSKRWRVDYGVDSKGYRRMAVPFRAKDCPAERTEFGHPDVAILFTHLSYYYSGLSDSQLEETFDILKRKQEAEMIYAGWLDRLKCEKVYKFLVSFTGVNLNDSYQKVKLFEMFRMHKGVIDFWLANTVFPQECKQFPGKSVMTAWDLCFERCKNPITGFSGTNDSNVLLPLPISQQDLAQLQDTNAKMERTLLRPENGNHKGLPMGVTCRQILEQVKADSCTVLIDSGALMLECDNEQVAQLWLEVDKLKEAVVYFNLDNELMVKFRGEHHHHPNTSQNESHLNLGFTTDTPFELSSYRDRLHTCGVYLDDQHTRGTDLKLPTGSKAGVTIGSGMRRDKLMQACMRMRKLGMGHSVSFYMSCEAHGKIMQANELLSGNSVRTQHVIKWVVQNSEEFNKDGLLYWAMAGRNYAQKLAADEFYDAFGTDPMEKINTLAHQCLDDEILLLKDLYGNYTQPELLTKLIPQWFEATENKLVNVPGCYILPQKISQKFAGIRDAVQRRCGDYNPEKLHLQSLGLEEEQEKEVEIEQETEAEQERQNVHLPGAAENEPNLHENVVDAVLSGDFGVKPGIVRLCDIFEKTTFWKLIQPGGWNCDVFCSQDFVSVVKSSRWDEKGDPHFKTDSYLRPVEYLASAMSSSGSVQILVLSPYEVNLLLPDFRSGKMSAQLHMFAARSSPSQDLLVNTPHLQLPRYSPVTIPPENALAGLLVASGNLYFGSIEEQRAFARFLALVPRPWSHEQACAFEKEMIKKSGFLVPKYRQQQQEHCYIQPEAFQKDPIAMVRKILACRHATVSDLAHVCKLLTQNWYVKVE